ncbi:MULTISPECIES: hypothetical protein [unclassified Blastococcus]
MFADQPDRGGGAGWHPPDWRPVDRSDLEWSVAAELVRTAPARRIGDDHHPRDVRAGRIDDGGALAFEIAVSASTGWIVEWAVTALSWPSGAPRIRWTPARLWAHDHDGLVDLPSGDTRFDARWRVLGAADDPRARRLATAPAVQRALLATDDGDEIWTAAGHVAALRPDGHRAALLSHHVRLLAVLRAALAEP